MTFTTSYEDRHISVYDQLAAENICILTGPIPSPGILAILYILISFVDIVSLVLLGRKKCYCRIYLRSQECQMWLSEVISLEMAAGN